VVWELPIITAFEVIRWFLSGPGLVPFSILVAEILCLILLDSTPFVLYLQAPFLMRPRSHSYREEEGVSEIKKEVKRASNPSEYLSLLVQRAEATAKASQRRAIALIFVGTLVAG
jgi:hypothetical protein